MSLVQNTPEAPCWQFLGEGRFIDPTGNTFDSVSGARQFSPPTSISVTSNGGGRVACERAPFDHPSLRLFNGHTGDHLKVSDQNHDNRADDDFLLRPEVGAAGVAAARCMRNDDGSL